MKHHLFSRFTSVLLAVVLLAGLMGTPILATDNVLGAEPAATVEEQTAGSADESASGVDSAAAEQAEETTADEEESASSDSSTDSETSDEDVVSGDDADSTVPAGDDSDSTAISEEESTDSVEVTEPAEEAAVELTTSVLDENGSTVADVTVEAAEGVIPEGAKLVAELLTGEKADKAAAELDEAGVEYDGYMALDIHLEDADGNEVEPNGEVRVVMVAPAALPEEADPTTVAVQHHEEQADGTVKVEQVASAADTAALAAAPATLSLNEDSSAETPAPTVTTDNNDLTAAFMVESFSSFTITWGKFGGRYITVKYVVDNGNYDFKEINIPGAPDGTKIPANGITTNSLEKYKKYAIDAGYTVVDVKREYDWSLGGWKYVDNITNIRYKNSSLQYEANGSWHDFNDWGDNLLIVCEKVVTPLETVETVDSLSQGVNITLFDYDQSTVNSATNSGFKFVNGTYGNGNWNTWVDGRGVIQGILQNKLNDKGFPVFSQKTNIRESNGQLKDLEYLFSTNKEVTKANRIVENVNNLFLQSAYDNTGYYEYYAKDNFASLQTDEEGNNVFKVYDTPYKPKDEAAGTPKFLPFNDLAEGDADNLKEGSTDYHFGMTVDFNFIQPKDGKVTHNGTTSDMVFEFTGDDDVWLFIDGALVLDMGGIHDAMTGSVNFATGQVKIETVYENGDSQAKTVDLVKLMRDAKGQDWVNANMVKNKDGNWVFKDYTSHSFKYYYLERGAGGSNCRIKFNLQTVPAGTLDIAKQISFTNTADASDIDFQFKAYIKTDPENSSDFSLFSGTYDVYKLQGDVLVKANQTATNGIITLKDGQYARLKDEDLIKANSEYYVIEVGATSDKYEVSIDETTLDYVDSDGNVIDGDATETAAGVKSDTYAVNERPRVIFTNKVVAQNLYTLTITKALANEQTAADDLFKMEVTIGGKRYEGKYKIDDTEYKASNGIVELKPGQTATITDLMGGNTIKVQEILLDGSKYGTPQYEISGSIKADTKNTVGYAYAVAEEGKALGNTPKVEVTVTNNRLKGDIIITKTIVNEAELTADQITAIKNSISFTLSGPDSYSGTFTGNKISWEGNTGTVRVYNVAPGEYTVTESAGGIEADDAILQATVQVNNDAAQELTNAGAQGIVSAGEVLNFAITNTYTPATGKLSIVKALDNGSTEFGDGKDVFSFKIQAVNESNVPYGTVWYMYVNGDGTATLDGSQTQLELPAGNYKITELSNINYTCTGIVSKKEVDNSKDIAARTITVKVGGNDVTTVTYTNSNKDTGFTDGSGVINDFIEENGVISFVKNWIAGDKVEIQARGN